MFHRQATVRPIPRKSATPTPATLAAQRPASFAPDREVFRLPLPVVIWWVWLAFAAANVVDFAVQGAPARLAAVVLALLATVTGLAYALALRPRVIAERVGLVIVNPFRDHHVPWGVIQTVDTGEWVQVHYSGATGTRTSASGKSISCWALYVSARAKRKAARGTPRPRGGRFRPMGMLGEGKGYAQDSRLPEEAKYLASLPVAKAIAVRLDARAGRERARAEHTGPVTARWTWPPLAAVAVPALALLIIVLV